MKTWKIITITTVTIAAVALLTTSVYASCGWGYNPFTGNAGTYGGRGGMMGGYGYGYNPYNPATPTQPGLNAPQTYGQYQTVYPFQFGGGCMGGFGGYGYTYTSPQYVGESIDLTTAISIANNYVASINNPDLVVTHIEEYSTNFYVEVAEQSTGNGAFELIINKYTGVVYPEMGPNMMWNTKYGMMRGGILGGIYGTPTTTMAVTEPQAQVYAQQFLDSYLPGTTVGEATTFYGYYTFEVLSENGVYGMLSVNGYSGQVWFHNWHGTFIQEVQLN
jgi:hypothetical protein